MYPLGKFSSHIHIHHVVINWECSPTVPNWRRTSWPAFSCSVSSWAPTNARFQTSLRIWQLWQIHIPESPLKGKMPLTATYARASRLFSPPCNRKPEFAHLRSHVKLQLGLGVEKTNSSSMLLPRDKKVIAAIPIPGTFLAASEIRTS